MSAAAFGWGLLVITLSGIGCTQIILRDDSLVVVASVWIGISQAVFQPVEDLNFSEDTTHHTYWTVGKLLVMEIPSLVCDVISIATVVSGKEEASVFIVYRQVRRNHQHVHQWSSGISVGAAVVCKDTSTVSDAAYCTLYIGIDVVYLCIVLVHLVVVVGMRSTDAVIGILASAADRYIVLLIIGVAEILIPPICISQRGAWICNSCRHCLVPCAISYRSCTWTIIIKFIYINSVIVRIQHINFFGWRAETGVSIEVDFRLALTTFLGSNHDNAVCTTHTIDGARCGILQYLDRLDFIIVRNVSWCVNNTVYYPQRVSATGNGSSTTDTDLSSGYVDTGRTSLQCIGDSTRWFQYFLRTQGGDGRGQIFFLLCTITHYYHIIQHLGIFWQCNIDCRFSWYGDFLSLVTHKWNLKCRVWWDIQGKISVEIGNGTIGCSFFHHAGTNDCFASSIFYSSFHCNVLCKCPNRNQA